jgi:hypothetical protein
MERNNATLHQIIIKEIVERGYAPLPMELAEWFGRPRAEVSTALHALMEDLDIDLHPNSDEIWVVHPFSPATGFLVRSGEREWWGNCAWCSLGTAELAGTACGPEAAPAEGRCLLGQAIGS